jgi:hypothetical protein
MERIIMLLGYLENDKMLVQLASAEMVATSVSRRGPRKSFRPTKTQMTRMSLTPRTKERGKRSLQLILERRSEVDLSGPRTSQRSLYRQILLLTGIATW